MAYENKSDQNDEYPFVDTLDKMAKFAHKDKTDKPDNPSLTEKNSRQADAHATADHESYRQYAQNYPAVDRQRGERLQAGSDRRKGDRFAAGSNRRRDERFAAESEPRKGERFVAGSDRRRDELFAAESNRRRDERFAAGSDRRRDERFAAGSDRRRDERLQSGSDPRKGDRFAAGSDRRRDERFAAESNRRRDERFAAESNRRKEERFAAESDPRKDDRFAAGSDRRADIPSKSTRNQTFAAGIAAAERTEKRKEKETTPKRLVALLCLPIVAVVVVIGLWAVIGRRSRNQGVLPNGKSVKYAAVSPSDGKNGAEKETAVTKAPPESDKSMVRVRDYAPDMRVDLKYAGKRNFTGKRIYDFEDAYLRYGTVKKLIKAQKTLKEYGMGLIIWDAYRPHAAQKKLWEVCPNPLYVKDPDKGYSDHTRGSAVDVTLVDSDGTELLMPTGFDNFTKLADRDYSDIDNDFARDNVKLLEKTMKAAGFQAYFEEWWHYTDSDSYEIEKNFVPEK